MKIISCIYMVGIPMYTNGFAKGLALFFVGHMCCGEALATMFIVNHVIEGVAFAEKNNSSDVAVRQPSTVDGRTPMMETQKALKKSDKVIPLNDWAAVQCQTSVNWAVGSWFWNHFSGGLNHQIEHHLFPSICHTNYVHIQKIVEDTCIEFGVPYQAERSLYSAYFKMIAHLRSLGRGDDLKKSDKKKD